MQHLLRKLLQYQQKIFLTKKHDKILKHKPAVLIFSG